MKIRFGLGMVVRRDGVGVGEEGVAGMWGVKYFREGA